MSYYYIDKVFCLGEKIQKKQKTLEGKYDISKNHEWQGENKEIIVSCVSQHKGASNVIVWHLVKTKKKGVCLHSA